MHPGVFFDMQEGGLRFSENVSIAKHPLVSVITVVYNSEQLIERTLRSVANQTAKNIEHVIIDGASKDQTLAIVKSFPNGIAYWLSEKDNGIYDAMNKGIEKANGNYLIFLNSGDEFFANDTIEKVFQNNENADVYYGDTIITNEQGEALRNRRLRPPTNLSWQSLQMGMVVCHQSVFVKKTIAVPYQTKYRISADIDWLIRCLKQAKTVCNTDLVISKFLDGGMSQTNQQKGLQERYEILNIHFGYLKNGFNHLKMIARLLANKLLN